MRLARRQDPGGQAGKSGDHTRQAQERQRFALHRTREIARNVLIVGQRDAMEQDEVRSLQKTKPGLVWRPNFAATFLLDFSR